MVTTKSQERHVLAKFFISRFHQIVPRMISMVFLILYFHIFLSVVVNIGWEQLVQGTP